jgi:EmrB/QacA subfamily drug resistance transporter
LITYAMPHDPLPLISDHDPRPFGDKPVSCGPKDDRIPDGLMPVSEKSRKVIPWIVATAFFMQMLDGTILNTALPSIAADLGEDPLRMQAVVISYLITVAMLIPASGWLADRFGIRRVFLASIALFMLGSLSCAASSSLPALVAGRVVQGVGGSMMTPVGRLAILRITSRNNLISVLSFIMIPGLVGPLIGPAVGGLLVEYASWHWIFLINLPVGALGLALTRVFMPPLIMGGVFKFDWVGFLLLAVAMLACTVGVEGLNELHFSPLLLGGLFGAALLCGALYVVVSRRVAHPLFDLGIFRNTSYSIGIAGNLISRLGSGAVPFLMPLLLQVGLGFSPSRAGLSMIPSAVGAMAGKALVTRAARRLGYRNLLLGNTIILGLMMMSFAAIDRDSNFPLLLLQLGCFGVFNSTQFSIMNVATLMDLPPAAASAGNSIFSLVQQLSNSLGVSVGAFVLAAFLALNALPGGATPSGGAALPAFHLTYIAIGCLTISSGLIFAFMPRSLGSDAKTE